MPQIALIGSGIVGLTTALEIQAKGHVVTIYAESLPGDDKSTRYTSPWAGAHHLMSPGDDQRKREFERETFYRLWADSEGGSEESAFLMRNEQREYYEDDSKAGKTELEHMPEFRTLADEELVGPAKSGVAFTTITIDTAAYLPFLLARFLSRGGRVRRTQVQHIDQVLLGSWGTPIPDALVVCPGLGARFLGGVEDVSVYPIRGQTVLVRAPWVKSSRGMREKNGDMTYIIPRRSGDVIIGGTYGVNDWYPHPRVETGRAILSRALVLMPELLPPNSRDASQAPTIADIEPIIIEHGCGLRPARKGGIRVESGTVVVGGAPGGKKVPVVYNYGHGGAGYQASWGTAVAATDLLEEGLTKGV
ncbi:D-amino-acid oxidase [Hysterangium stoloniferum]|nr:D-amino-acid oxidase [Hysterangium stoloniferum]